MVQRSKICARSHLWLYIEEEEEFNEQPKSCYLVFLFNSLQEKVPTIFQKDILLKETRLLARLKPRFGKCKTLCKSKALVVCTWIQQKSKGSNTCSKELCLSCLSIDAEALTPRFIDGGGAATSASSQKLCGNCGTCESCGTFEMSTVTVITVITVIKSSTQSTSRGTTYLCKVGTWDMLVVTTVPLGEVDLTWMHECKMQNQAKNDLTNPAHRSHITASMNLCICFSLKSLSFRLLHIHVSKTCGDV